LKQLAGAREKAQGVALLILCLTEQLNRFTNACAEPPWPEPRSSTTLSAVTCRRRRRQLCAFSF